MVAQWPAQYAVPGHLDEKPPDQHSKYDQHLIGDDRSDEYCSHKEQCNDC